MVTIEDNSEVTIKSWPEGLIPFPQQKENERVVIYLLLTIFANFTQNYKIEIIVFFILWWWFILSVAWGFVDVSFKCLICYIWCSSIFNSAIDYIM